MLYCLRARRSYNCSEVTQRYDLHTSKAAVYHEYLGKPLYDTDGDKGSFVLLGLRMAGWSHRRSVVIYMDT